MRQHLQQQLAQLVSYAFHDPNNIPDLTRKAKTPDRKMGEREATERLRAALISMHANNSKRRH